jgi:choline kinase
VKIIITMAGFGSRFTKAGFNIPKYEIEVLGKTLFEWSMDSLEDLKNEHFVFIVRKDERQLFSLESLIKKARIKFYNVIIINNVTNGQATTALLADKFIDEVDEVVIFNIDTFIIPYSIKKSDFSYYDGFLHTFKAEGDHWSFAKTNNSGKVIEVTEKIRISNNASVGLYYFKKWSIFKETYYKNFNTIIEKYKEMYIAPIYNFIIEDYNIGIKEIPLNNVYVLGTPDEVLYFKKNYKPDSK